MMVSRKPLPASAIASVERSPSSSYSNNPAENTTSVSHQVQDIRGSLEDESTGSDNSWEDEAIKKQNTGQNDPLPNSLRVGPPGDTPRTSQERLAPSNTNPFIRSQSTGESVASGKESSANAWATPESQEAPRSNAPLVLPSTAPPRRPLPQDYTPLPLQFSNLSVAEPVTNPWQPQSEPSSSQEPLIPTMIREDSGTDAWGPIADGSNQASISNDLGSFAEVDGRPETTAWRQEQPAVSHAMPANGETEAQQINEESHAWDNNVGHSMKPNAQAIPADGHRDDWNLIDHQPDSVGAQHSGVISSGGTVLQRFNNQGQAPDLPPRPSEDSAPPQPPRPMVNITTNESASSSAGPSANARKQKKETYEIKRIAWHDVNAAENPRISPILVQNANGPCPLLALVNALTLSTPANVDTALVETLRSREQVSLGLLLDAVFDELMSGRRGDGAQELPDVGDLYSFLVTLHTGMNVNPRFFPPPPSKSANDPRNSMSHVHPSEREGAIPGTFEETMEMKLYSTFSVPLIHGWLPESDSPAYASLKRTAQSYEDAQNMFFYEEELENKLQREGLSFEEQWTLEDIATIKAFFASNATQLTPHGLDVIKTSVAPGSVAILFRNDHFSTLYRHPDTLELLQLVTDMGYAGHDEVVWESLVDVNGENAEFFSGDFRLVGGAPQTPGANQSGVDGWTNVTGRRQNQASQSSYQTAQSSGSAEDTLQSSNTEQEDHDLALALQLQEEEEERHRNETSRRLRESELSRQFIEQQGHDQVNIPVSQRGSGATRGRGRGGSDRTAIRGGGDLRPAIPPRRTGTGTGGGGADAGRGRGIGGGNRPVDPEAGVDVPPPSYEQAANQAAYMPPTDHPAHPNSSPNGSGRRASGYSINTPNYQGGSPLASRISRRGTGPQQGTPIGQTAGGATPVGAGVTNGSKQERDCIMM